MTESQRSVRAFVLMAVGITLGALVLGVGFDNSGGGDTIVAATLPQPTATPEPSADPSVTDEVDAGEGEGPDDTAPTPTPDPDLHPVSEVRVIVANSTDVDGAAAAVSDSLIANGGYNATPANATGDRNVLPTTIYFVEDYEPDARQVAALAGLTTAVFTPMIADPPVADVVDVHVLVILGVEPPPPEE